MYSTRRGNFFGFVFMFFFIVVSTVVSVIIVYGIPALASSTLVNVAITQIGIIFLPVLFYIKKNGFPFQETLRLYKTSYWNYVLSFALAIFCIPTVMAINVLSQFFVTPVINETLTQADQEPFFLSLIVIALFPAIFEEMLTRGVLLSHYRYQKIWTASLMCGFFFGMVHMNINQFLYAFFLGTLFAIVLHLTGSIFCTMLMHFTINGLNLALSYISTSPSYQNSVEAAAGSSNLLSSGQAEQLISALPILFFLMLITIPPFLFCLIAMTNINGKTKLLLMNAPSYLFFKSSSELAKQETDMMLSDDGYLQKKEPIATPSFIMAIILFLLIAISTELG